MIFVRIFFVCLYLIGVLKLTEIICSCNNSNHKSLGLHLFSVHLALIGKKSGKLLKFLSYKRVLASFWAGQEFGPPACITAKALTGYWLFHCTLLWLRSSEQLTWEGAHGAICRGDSTAGLQEPPDTNETLIFFDLVSCCCFQLTWKLFCSRHQYSTQVKWEVK